MTADFGRRFCLGPLLGAVDRLKRRRASGSALGEKSRHARSQRNIRFHPLASTLDAIIPAVSRRFLRIWGVEPPNPGGAKRTFRQRVTVVAILNRREKGRVWRVACLPRGPGCVVARPSAQARSRQARGQGGEGSRSGLHGFCGERWQDCGRACEMRVLGLAPMCPPVYVPRRQKTWRPLRRGAGVVERGGLENR